ncbi:S-adenosyl-L-methionine-dependent methyltransferase [Lichtheimia hyalospora FSU 10163]|nr:S-adenosyl-L-methionine-dependent methyltransferase [Lichtheimia hyalospora FSU 10163]
MTTTFFDSIKEATTIEKQPDVERPLAYVKGEAVFCDLKFKVSEKCLIPRERSKVLVDAAEEILLEEIKKDPIKTQRVLDIGTGSGNLLLSLMHRIQNTHGKWVKGVGIDISEDAIEVARENRAWLNVVNAEFVACDMALLDSNHLGLFDLVLANPPYTVNTMPGTRLYEPTVAMFTGDEGFECYTIINTVAPKIMHPHAKLVIEFGRGMCDRIKIIMTQWKAVAAYKDQEGYDRWLVLEQL